MSDIEAMLAVGPRLATRAMLPWGHVLYSVIEEWSFAHPEAVDDGFDVGAADASGNLRTRCADAILVQTGLPARRFLLETVGHARMQVLPLPWSLALDVVGAHRAPVFKIVSLGVRNQDLSSLVQNEPRLSLVARWRKEQDVAGRSRARTATDQVSAELWEQAAFELPRVSKKGTAVGDAGSLHPDCYAGTADPLRTIRALRFSGFLKATRDFSAAIGAAEHYDHPDLPTEGRRTGQDDVHRTGLQTGRGNTDICGMLLTRREIKADRLAGRVQAALIFTDASPVTGEELQGMVLEVVKYKKEDTTRIILPGSTLSYAQMNLVSKTMALLFSLWLVAGPWFCDLAWLLSKVRGLTTDFGHEIRTIEIPDVLKAFLAWNAGASLQHARGLVNHGARLFARALRVGGWSHANGNLLRKVAQSYIHWPKIISQIRSLCAFYRNATYRKYVARCVRGKPVDARPLNHFTGTVAKWRYHTVDASCEELLPLRDTSGNYVFLALFCLQNAQDRVQVQDAVEAASDKNL